MYIIYIYHNIPKSNYLIYYTSIYQIYTII